MDTIVPQSTLYSRQKRSIEHNPEQVLIKKGNVVWQQIQEKAEMAKAEDAKETRNFEVKFGLM